MKFTTIQDKQTNEITQYWLNGVRVSKAKYQEEERIKEIQNKQFSCVFTYRTRTGNFRHTKYSTI